MKCQHESFLTLFRKYINNTSMEVPNEGYS